MDPDLLLRIGIFIGWRQHDGDLSALCRQILTLLDPFPEPNYL
jgi:hypothetical protein